MMKSRNSIIKIIFQKLKNIKKVDCLVIEAGIVGIIVAKELSVNHGRQVLIFDHAPIYGSCTSSHNTEVIHAGIYYPPNSLKVLSCFLISKFYCESCCF
ncbi:hypothetical protein R3W88_001321 [Solanum pinnatisectum]|uniref:L-2-hydroxyglutarate dehydrogenase, mitochondrial n=1 Tax=Solanum pinnatisectum TaxID=50273 RepID=A0AAV9MKL9_9SOLN|nr:hypothetical protein R3W88_001321 [Solanum pinnatisectum]